MIQYFRRNKSFRFTLISILLTVAAIGALMISAVAGQVGDDELASLGSKAALGLALIIVIYVVPRMVRAMKIEYLRSEYSIHVPNAGLVFLAVIMIVTILALSSGNNLLYLVLSMLLSTLVISWVSSRLCLARLSLELRAPEHIFAEEPVPLDVFLTSRSRIFPGFSVLFSVFEQNVASGKPEKIEHAYFPVIPRGAQARARSERVYPARGIYRVTGCLLSTRFPFGFIEHRRLIDRDAEVIVYPRPRPLDEYPGIAPIELGRTESHIKGSGTDLYAIRSYQASDHHHHIDWKATAKTAQLMVREFTRDDEWRVLIGFDTAALREAVAGEGFPARFERAIGLAAGLSEYFIDQGAEVRLLAPGGDTGYGIGRYQHYEILSLLARLNPVPAETEGLSESIRPEFAGESMAEERQRLLIVSMPAGVVAGSVGATTQVVSVEEM